MAKAKPSAQAELEELRERAAAERVKQRHLGDALETARAHVEQADEAISSAYGAEDDAAIAAARVALADAEADDLARRHAALDSRIRAAQATVDAYVEKHADDLIGEAVAAAALTTQALVDRVRDVLRVHHRLLDERGAIDRLVSGTGANVRLDGPAGQHAWEHALVNLDRVVKAHPSLDAPVPRWRGRAEAQERDRTHRLLRAQREHDQAEVERLQGESL